MHCFIRSQYENTLEEIRRSCMHGRRRAARARARGRRARDEPRAGARRAARGSEASIRVLRTYQVNGGGQLEGEFYLVAYLW